MKPKRPTCPRCLSYSIYVFYVTPMLEVYKCQMCGMREEASPDDPRKRWYGEGGRLR